MLISTANLIPFQLPYWIVEFQDEAAVRKLASRSVSIKSISELWGQGTTRPTFHSELKKTLASMTDSKYFDKSRDFKIIVETYNKHFLHREKVALIETMDYLPFTAPVNLKTPQDRYMYYEFYGLDPNNVPEEPEAILFGRLISHGQRDMIQKLSLKTRKFIGNTSMDPTLSVLMANQCAIQPGDIVFDPFVGTGSLLVAAAHFGAYCFGSDIDYLMLHGKTRPSRISQKIRESDESVQANFKQYGLDAQYLDVFVADFSQPYWREDFKFNAIITDPPYGIREATERVKTNKEKPQELIENENLQHYPQTQSYQLFELVADLLDFAAEHLAMNGRVVFWMPFYRADYKESLLPQHECLKLIANSEQILSSHICRRLLTFEKTRELDEEEQQQGDNLSSEKYEFDFRERYFNPTALSRKQRRQIKYEENMARKRPESDPPAAVEN